uniref:Uncharacterized protein n=1 Tax=Arundo donax TaxID=35708 RepID=A0A0A8YWT6_ARUDO
MCPRISPLQPGSSPSGPAPPDAAAVPTGPPPSRRPSPSRRTSTRRRRRLPRSCRRCSPRTSRHESSSRRSRRRSRSRSRAKKPRPPASVSPPPRRPHRRHAPMGPTRRIPARRRRSSTTPAASTRPRFPTAAAVAPFRHACRSRSLCRGCPSPGALWRRRPPTPSFGAATCTLATTATAASAGSASGLSQSSSCRALLLSSPTVPSTQTHRAMRLPTGLFARWHLVLWWSPCQVSSIHLALRRSDSLLRRRTLCLYCSTLSQQRLQGFLMVNWRIRKEKKHLKG